VENDEIVQSIVTAVREEDPENPVLKTIDGFFLLREEPPALAAAKTLFEDAAAASPRDVNAQWGLARVAMSEQDFPRALGHAERAATLAPDVPILQLQLGEILSRLGRRLEAEKALKRVLNANPNSSRALQLLIDSLIERKDVRQARELLTRLEKADGLSRDDASVLQSLRGRILVAEGDDAAAERLLRDQLDADPGNVVLVGDLARAVSRQGRAGEAVELLDRFARSHPSEPEAWISLATLYLDDGSEQSLEKASTALTRALLADPQSIPALRNMLNVRLRQGNLVEAVGLCDRYLERNPDSAEILNTKALILSETPGQLNVAGETINRAISLDNRPEYQATRGIILLRQGETRRALEELQSAASGMQTTTARVDLALAEAYYETRELQSAQRYYDLAVQKSAQGDAVNAGRLARLGALLKSQDSAA
jgi:tetratricopeptide (TPR) repeat protein